MSKPSTIGFFNKLKEKASEEAKKQMRILSLGIGGTTTRAARRGDSGPATRCPRRSMRLPSSTSSGMTSG